MDKNEYLKRKKDIISRFNKERYALDLEFAIGNASLNIGDFAEDHIGRIKIDTVEATFSSISKEFPCALYKGPCYTKQGRPFKSGERREVFATNLV